MWPSPGRNINNSNKNNRSSSKSSSTCSSPSSQTTNYNPRKSMEEVWKDINLSCLQERPSTTVANTNNHHALTGMILQDFFAKPFGKDPISSSSAAAAAVTITQASSACVTDHDFLNSKGSRHASTLLSLNSTASDFQYIENSASVKQNHHHLHNHSSIQTPISPFDALGSSSVFPSSSISKKWPQENLENSSDRRHKRMIKNRESAARSRARKQAYTQELELEVANLLEENARLRRQQEVASKKLLATPAQLPKKNSLYRTLTAPF